MNKLLISLLCLVLSLSQRIVFSAEKHQNDIVASVNGKTIKQEDIANRLNNFKDTDPETHDDIRQEIIDHLITDILLEEFIEKQGLIVTQAAVEKEIDQIKNSVKGLLSLEQVLDSLGSNLSEFKKSIKHSLALEMYFADKIDDRVLEIFFGKNKNLFNGESVRVSHILIDTRNMKTQEEFSQALEQIRSIKKEIDQGNAFEEIAKKYSNCPSVLIHGDLGFIQRKGTLAKSFLDMAFSLPVNQVGGPVQTEYGYHFIKVTERREGSNIRFEDIKEKVRLEVLDTEIINLIDRLRREAHIVAYH
jgi:parvulin-like peptidyl-prolyl isomerase